MHHLFISLNVFLVVCLSTKLKNCFWKRQQRFSKKVLWSTNAWPSYVVHSSCCAQTAFTLWYALNLTFCQLQSFLSPDTIGIALQFLFNGDFPNSKNKKQKKKNLLSFFEFCKLLTGLIFQFIPENLTMTSR